MKCPTCPDAVLVIADRSGIEIDYCPECRGVWLDRGELDKIVARSSDDRAPVSAAPSRPSGRYPAEESRWDADDDDDWRDGRAGGKRRRRSMLGDLFDF